MVCLVTMEPMAQPMKVAIQSQVTIPKMHGVLRDYMRKASRCAAVRAVAIGTHTSVCHNWAKNDILYSTPNPIPSAQQRETHYGAHHSKNWEQ
jgi:hypothetical protein